MSRFISAADPSQIGVLYGWLGNSYDTIFAVRTPCLTTSNRDTAADAELCLCDAQHAHALRKLNESGLPVTGPNLFNTLKSLSFEGVTGTVEFDSNGDRYGQFTLFGFNTTTRDLDTKFFYSAKTDSLTVSDSNTGPLRFGKLGSERPPLDHTPRTLT